MNTNNNNNNNNNNGDGNQNQNRKGKEISSGVVEERKIVVLKKVEPRKVVRMEDIPSSSAPPTAVVDPQMPFTINLNLPPPPPPGVVVPHYVLARINAIESEPKTLFHAQISVARAAALQVLNSHSREEAMQIFLTGLQPTRGGGTASSENGAGANANANANADAPTENSVVYDAYYYDSDSDYDFDDEDDDDEDLTEDLTEDEVEMEEAEYDDEVEADDEDDEE